MRLSSKIRAYPGTELSLSDIEAERFLVMRYETVLRYSWTSGVAISRFLDGLSEGEIWGLKCAKCRRILIPPRAYCEEDFVPTDEWVRVKDTGVVNTFSVSYVNNDASRRKRPIIVAVVDIDGASQGMGILHLLDEIEPRRVEIGMKVEAVWKPKAKREGAITDIRYFRPRR